MRSLSDTSSRPACCGSSASLLSESRSRPRKSPIAFLAWNWLIEQPIVSDTDEMTVGGEDHPARLYLGFESADGDSHAMEIRNRINKYSAVNSAKIRYCILTPVNPKRKEPHPGQDTVPPGSAGDPSRPRTDRGWRR